MSVSTYLGNAREALTYLDSVQSGPLARHAEGLRIQPDKMAQNPFIESFNGRCLCECLTALLSTSFGATRRIIE